MPVLPTGTTSYPLPLSAEEEACCLEALTRGDRKARDRLIEHNLRLVAHIAKKYGSLSPENEDLLSIGAVGLIKGVDSFDPHKGVRLATYLSRCIENAILSQPVAQFFKYCNRFGFIQRIITNSAFLKFF